jgi:hypothetical protein
VLEEMTVARVRVLGVTVLLLWAASAAAQTPRPAAPATRAPAPATRGRLLVTVVDQTNAVLPTATVTITGLEDATKQQTLDPITASVQGLATAEGLAPGRYRVQAEFPGFQTAIVNDTRVRAGDNKLTITLALEKMSDSVTVAQDAQAAAADPHGSSFGTAMTRDQIDALSNDPDELAQQLNDIAGAGATIRVDSFEGSQLPPKSQIKSIHITRDGFAAENHNAGAIFVDIITQPGVGALRGGISTRLRDGAFSGRNQFTGTTPPEMTEDGQLYLGGSLIPQRASFSLNLSGTSQYVKPVLNVALPTGDQSTVIGQKQQTDRLGINALLDYAITKDQTLRLSYNQFSTTQDNLGIGAYDLPERAYSTNNQTYQFRVQEAGPLGRRLFTNTRLNLTVTNADSHAVTEAPTIQVLDSFTSGGAQVAGGRDGKAFTLASDLDYVRGIHSVRGGILMDGGWYRSDATSNYLGTYTFASQADYEAGIPLAYTQHIGDPTVTYFALQAGAYVQDDIRIRKNLTLSPGVRYELQAHVKGNANIGPRLGVTWSPFKNGRTTLRSSAGIFYDWMSASTYEQLLRLDGFHQQELNIINPSYPNPTSASGVIPPTDRYLLGSGVNLPQYRRLSGGIDQTIGTMFRINTTYSHTTGVDLWRGENLNAAVNGVRPDPTFANIVQVVSDASQRQDQWTTSVSANLAGLTSPPFVPGSPGPLLDWKRIVFNGFYTLSKITNNTDGPFSLPATGDINLEWGPAANDVRQRINVGLNSNQIKNLNVNLNLTAATGSPYDVTTGADDNGDGVFNDRPPGVDRNSERTMGQWYLNAFVAYTFVFGRSTVAAPPGIGINVPAPGAAPIVTTFNAPPPRYRLQFIVSAQNVTNHANYGGYSGTLTSPFFSQPTLVLNPRKVDVGLQLSF